MLTSTGGTRLNQILLLELRLQEVQPPRAKQLAGLRGHRLQILEYECIDGICDQPSIVCNGEARIVGAADGVACDESTPCVLGSDLSAEVGGRDVHATRRVEKAEDGVGGPREEFHAAGVITVLKLRHPHSLALHGCFLRLECGGQEELVERLIGVVDTQLLEAI